MISKIVKIIPKIVKIISKIVKIIQKIAKKSTNLFFGKILGFGYNLEFGKFWVKKLDIPHTSIFPDRL